MDRNQDWWYRTINRKLNSILIQGVMNMATLAELTTQVQRNADVEQSALILIKGIAQQLKDAILQGDPVKIQELQTQLSASADALAAAVAENTPSG